MISEPTAVGPRHAPERAWKGCKGPDMTRSQGRPCVTAPCAFLPYRSPTRKVGLGEGFRAPAFATVGRAPGPALESLPRRKPRGGRGTVCRARLWGFEDRGRLTSEASAAGRAQSFQRKGRRRLFSMATMGGSEALASVVGGLATS